MAYDETKPAGADAVKDSDQELRANFVHLKAAINQEHVWDDATATNTVHDEGVGRIFVDTYANRPTSDWLKGRMFYSTDTDKLYYDDGTQLVEVDIGGSYLKLAGGTMSGAIAMGTQHITGVDTPTNAETDYAANVSYVQSYVAAGTGAHATTHTTTDLIQDSDDTHDGLMTKEDHALLPTSDEKAALAGEGTPAAGNKYTCKDYSLFPTSDEKAALAGEGTPAAGNKFTCKDYVDALVSVKVKLETRLLTEAAGDVSYTGYGFQPDLIMIQSNSGSGGSSQGSGRSASERYNTYAFTTSNGYGSTKIMRLWEDGSQYQDADLKTMDADGFTLTWTKTSTPTGTPAFIVTAFKF